MGRHTLTPEPIITKLRQFEVRIASGKAAALACKDADISAQTYTAGGRNTAGLRGFL